MGHTVADVFWARGLDRNFVVRLFRREGRRSAKRGFRDDDRCILLLFWRDWGDPLHRVHGRSVRRALAFRA